MANEKKDDTFLMLPATTMIDVIFLKGETVIIKPMTFGEAYYLKPKPGWRKLHYQTGQHGFKATETLDKTK